MTALILTFFVSFVKL